MEPYGIRETRSGDVTLDRGGGTLDPRTAKGPMPTPEHEKERLSAIIRELNDRYGAGLRTDLSPEAIVGIATDEFRFKDLDDPTPEKVWTGASSHGRAPKNTALHEQTRGSIANSAG